MRRQFHYLGEPTDEGLIPYDRDEVRQTLLDLEGAIYQLGGVVTVSAVRREIGPDQYVTTGVVMAYDSFVPKYEGPKVEPGEIVEVDENGLRAS